MQTDYEKKLSEAIEKRLVEMERADYEYPKRMDKKDYVVVIVVVIGCLIGIIWGAYL